MGFEFCASRGVGREDDALFLPGGQYKAVGTALPVLLVVQIGRQRPHRIWMALGDEAVLAGVQGLSPDLVVQPVLHGTAVEPDLCAAGGHVGPVVEGVFPAAADTAVAAADGHRSAAQIGIHRGQLRHLPLSPVGFQRFGDPCLVREAILIDGGEADGKDLIPQQIGICIAQGLPQVGHRLGEGGSVLFGSAPEGQELVHGTADPHHRSGPVCHLPAAGDHRHGHVDVVGTFHPLIAVVGRVLCRPGLNAPGPSRC